MLFIYGLLLHKFGLKMIFSTFLFVLIGNILFASGMYWKMAEICILGRSISGIGGSCGILTAACLIFANAKEHNLYNYLVAIGIITSIAELTGQY